MAQSVVCIPVVIWLVLHISAIGSLSMPHYIYGIRF